MDIYHETFKRFMDQQTHISRNIQEIHGYRSRDIQEIHGYIQWIPQSDPYPTKHLDTDSWIYPMRISWDNISVDLY